MAAPDEILDESPRIMDKKLSPATTRDEMGVKQAKHTPEYQFLRLKWNQQQKEKQEKLQSFNKAFHSAVQHFRARSAPNVPRAKSAPTVRKVGFGRASVKDKYESLSDDEDQHQKRTNVFLDANKTVGVFSIAVMDHQGDHRTSNKGYSKNLPMVYSKGTLMYNHRVVTNEIIRTFRTKQKSRLHRIQELENRLENKRKEREKIQKINQKVAELKKELDDNMKDTRKGYGDKNETSVTPRMSENLTIAKTQERKERIKRRTFMTSCNFRMSTLLDVLEKRDYKYVDAKWYQS